MGVDIPDSCKRGEHDYDQTNRCNNCGAYKNNHETARFSGGAGARRHALSDEDYKRQMRKLTR